MDVDGGVVGRRGSAWIVRRQIGIDRQPDVVVLKVMMVVVGLDGECLAPTCPCPAGAQQQCGAEEHADGADHGPQGFTGHEGTADGTDALAEPHAALGLYLSAYAWDQSAAEKELRRAIELKPNYATTYHWLGNVLSFAKRPDEAIVAARRAEELDPLSAIISADTGFDLILARRYDEALAQLQQPVPIQQLQKLCGIRTASVCSALAELSTQGEVIRNARGYQLKLPFPVSLPIDPKGNGNGKAILCSSGG